jgi:phosphoenolpyruvate-protein phosphotransferase (PTS system enzyme I)
MLKGIAVSPGIAVARAYCVDSVLARREPQVLNAAAVSAEVARFDAACQSVALEMDATIARVSAQLGEDEADIFRGHRQLLRDPTLVSKVKSSILNRRLDVRSALHELLDEYTALFARIEDDYLKERMADIRDVVARIIAQLSLNEAPTCLTGDEPVILVAPEILPSQALLLEKFHVVGIITEAGGSTGHAAILARSMGIPSVSGLRGILKQVVTGDLLALDGRVGSVFLKPDREVEAVYRKAAREYVHMRDKLVANRDQDAVTSDGTKIELLANVNSVHDAEAACRTGATGVGLYRTEYLFLTHPSVPTEEEQYATYKAVIEASPNRKVTIRTLDIGGDKLVPYFGHEREANPFMGWRSIRITSSYPEFFQTQLRAILRAGVHGDISLLFPMISTLEEVRILRRMVGETMAQLKRGGIAFAEKVPLGIMLEVPAAALAIHSLLLEVDYISIGSNDLIQYVMAADRDNPKVAHLCEPFSPPLFRLLRYVLKACDRQNKPATLCGEMAGRPRCFLPLLGMGLRRFSMSPAFVPTIKEVARSICLSKTQEIAARIVRLRTFRQVRRYLTTVTRQVCPNVTFLDTKK